MSFEARTVPHDLEAERAVLGAVLIDNHVLDTVRLWLPAESFFRRGHQAIYRAFCTLSDAGAAMDLITIRDALQKAGELEEAGGPAYLAECTTGVPRSANIEYYGKIVQERAMLRRAIKLGNQILDEAYVEGALPGELLAKADRDLLAIRYGSQRGRGLRLADSMADLCDEMEARGNGVKLLGHPTGWPRLDETLLGWQNSDYTVVGARPSIGKSAFFLNTTIAMAQYFLAAKLDHTAMVFSLEMRRKQLEYRIISILSGVDKTRIMTGTLYDHEREQVGAAMAAMSTLPIWIDDSARQTLGDIRAQCRRQLVDGPIGVVVIDYFQLITGSSQRRNATRNEELTEVSRGFKILADEAQAPLIVLSQLNRKGEFDSKPPTLESLRETGALEQDADAVLFLHRRDHRKSGETLLIIEKQRNGGGGTVKMDFNRDTQVFTEMPPEDPK